MFDFLIFLWPVTELNLNVWTNFVCFKMMVTLIVYELHMTVCSLREKKKRSYTEQNFPSENSNVISWWFRVCQKNPNLILEFKN
jgi:hypothetical protein